jgi:hypothetical protein
LLNGDGVVVRMQGKSGRGSRIEGNKVPSVRVAAMGFEVGDDACGIDSGAMGPSKGPLWLGKDIV